MRIRPHRKSRLRPVAALLTGLVGFLAFNVIDGVFGLIESLLGLGVSIAITVFVIWSSPPPKVVLDV
jgi:uncharacterized membrane protein YuzA (DUF378 family)